MLGLVVLLSVFGLGAYVEVTADGDDDDDFLDFDGVEPGEVEAATSGDDVITGSREDDVIDGGAGADILGGFDGDDVVRGGTGNDSLSGGDGEDTLDGGVGEDFLYGDFGDDLVEGGDGNDAIGGGPGQDTILGGDGDDQLFGIENVIVGQDLEEALEDLFQDREGGADILDGGTGDDLIVLADEDVGTGGEGADLFGAGTYIDEAQAPRVTDFNVAEDSIELVYEDGTPEPLVTFPVVEGNTEIRMDGETVMVLEGVTEIEGIRVFLSTDAVDLV